MLRKLEIFLLLPLKKHKSARGFNCLQYSATVFSLGIYVSVPRNIITNYNQQDAMFLDLFISTDRLKYAERL